ncbi:MAG: hypothetical protein ACPLRY_06275 [Candidatus Bathyarchaeales archaeon]
MSAYEILKVLYAPQKAFREIIQNPRYLMPIIIVILFVAANAAATYALVSKTYVEKTFPAQKDEWTENVTLWQPTGGVYPTANYADYIKGLVYGNKSIEFAVKNSSEVSMQLDNIGPINCSGQDGYKKLYVRIKCTSPNSAPKNVSIYLYSTALSNFFYRDLTENFSSATIGIWNNLTISIADGNWSHIGDADWANITGLNFVFEWSGKSDITILVDGLFFGGVYTPYAENVTAYLASYSAYSFMQFVIRWVFLAGIIHIMSKAFKANIVWRVTLILVGSALITMFIQALVNTAVFSTTLSPIKYSFAYLGGVEGESAVAYNQILEETWLVNQIYSYVQAAIIIWTIALCGLAVRLLTGFSWAKSFLIAAVAYFAATTIESFLVR